MTKEQEEALYRLKLHSEYAVLSNDKLAVVNKADIETVLSMLKEKDKEINHYILNETIKKEEVQDE